MTQLSLHQIHVSMMEQFHSLDDSSSFCLEEEDEKYSFSLRDNLRKTLFNEDFCPINDDDRGLVVANGYHLSSTPGASQEEGDSPDSPLTRMRRGSVDQLYRNNSYDPNLFNVKQVSPEQFAEQLTLIDLALLKSIRRDEFQNCNWTKKEKQTLSPNIVAVSRRFNHTSFLIVRDILNERNLKSRAEIIMHFIRVAKRLQELNNLHSLVAVVLAIDSPPIARLQLTWKQVAKKERNSLERLVEFVSEKDNYAILRGHIQSHAVPCIPHLALHQRDIVYIDSMKKRHPDDISKYEMEISKILDFIEHCQDSRYDSLNPIKAVQKYLNSVLYIDELQKFFEDDNYKLSLQIEPPARKSLRGPSRPPPYPSFTLRSSKSSEDLLTPPLEPEYTGPDIATPPRRTLSNHRSDADILVRRDKKAVPVSMATAGIPLATRLQAKGVTLPANLDMSGKDLKKVSSRDSEAGSESRKVKSSSPSLQPKKRSHAKTQSLGNNVWSALGIKQSSRASSPEQAQNVSLIDDSVLDNNVLGAATSDYTTPSASVGSNNSSIDVASFDEMSEEVPRESDDEVACVDNAETEILYEGLLKRRVIKKSGKSYHMKLTHQFWVQLTPSHIILLPPKYKNPKKAVNGNHLKYIALFGSRVKHGDPLLKLKDRQFILMDNKGNETKFTSEGGVDTHLWVEQIRRAIINEEDRLRRQEEEKPLIKF